MQNGRRSENVYSQGSAASRLPLFITNTNRVCDLRGGDVIWLHAG